MSEKSFRTILFVALLLVAPAFLFLVQVVFFVPPVFLFAALAYQLKTMVAGRFTTDSLSMLLILLPHLLIFTGFYWLIAWATAKLASLIPRGWARHGLLSVLLLALAGISQLPIYGGGGHGPIKIGPWQSLLRRLEHNYGSGTSLVVYLTALALVVAAVVWLWWQNRRASGMRRG